MRTEKKVSPNVQEHSSEEVRAAESESGSPIVDIIGRLGITGNVIPAEWYQTIKGAVGTPDWVTITILSEIVYWYRPKLVRKDGRSRFVKRFARDLLQLRRGALERKFGISKRHVSRSLEKLEKLGVIRRHLRNLDLDAGGKLGNVLYIELLPEGVAKITGIPLPDMSGGIDVDGNSSGQGGQEVLPYTPGAIDAESRTNTKTATKITTISSSSGAKRPQPGDKITRNNSGSAASGAAAPGPAAAPVGLPSAESGLLSRTPQVDPEIERAKRRADRLIRFITQTHSNLLSQKISDLPPLSDHLERSRLKIEEYLRRNRKVNLACILELVITCWLYDLAENAWYSRKLRSSPGVLCVRLGSGENQKEFTLEGAALEQDIDLFTVEKGTHEKLKEAGIYESYLAEVQPGKALPDDSQ